ncbi:MMPL family transporter [Flavobacterium sp. 3HN19-14]|uniref:MMPL family transporter n=1 Tax=Flavobacterium sp. 3HN19-14 TaxID=3448133 RepID=UPI003EE131BA
MQRCFLAINSFARKHKFLFFGIFVAIVVLLGFLASRISFQENITQLIPSNDQSGITSKVLQQVNFADKITIVVKSENSGTPEDLTAYANVFLDDVTTKCKPYVGKIQGKVEEENIQETIDFVYNNLPIFLDKSDYESISQKIIHDSIPKIIEADYKSIISPAGLVSKDFILKDPLGISFIALKKLQQLSVGDDFGLQDGFVLTKDKKNLLLFITPKLPANETDQNTIFIAQLEQIRKNLNTQFKGKVSMSYFGATPVAVANATQIKADVRNTSIFAVVTLVLILVFFYRNFSTPVIIFIPSLLGAVVALAVLYVFKGTISAISLGISSILLGETTDYSIYVLTHLRNKKDVRLLYKDISKPLMLCGVTTGITFLCLFFIQSEALNDLGIFASLSVIATSFFSLVLIPLLYKIKGDKLVVHSNIIDKLGTFEYHKNKFLVGGSLILLVITLFTYSKASFNTDLSALNFMTPELKQTEHQLDKIANLSSKSIYLVTYGDTYEEVLENNNKLFNALGEEKKSGNVLNFSSIGGFIFSEEVQKQKIADWNAFWTADKKANLHKELVMSGTKFGFKDDAFSTFYATLSGQFQPASYGDFAKIKSFFLEEFVANKNNLHTISTLVKVANDKRDAFVSNIKKQNKIVIIDRQETNETFLTALKSNFEKLIDYSFCIIFLVLFLAFRRVELAFISIVPILVSWIFTTGLMAIFGIQFNVINIIVCTLVFGIGVDYSIFMTMALQKEHTFGKPELPTYKTSILLSVATTILGIGVLIFAKHPALKSISLIAIIGMFSTLLITFVFQPLVFHFFVTGRVNKGRPPFEIRRMVHSTLSFIYYGLGGFLLSVFSKAMMFVIPISKQKKLRAFHAVLSKFMESVFWTYPSNRRKILNKSNEKFDKPAVIIANHSSFLDILAVGMLSPKIVFLVSDWVYNSPVFGMGVRLAGFYPVSQGIDNGIDHLKKKVEQGFSLMVFPEGTRSEDNTIKRFHKGAFYLAEELNLDIIPVVIHGYSEILPKGDFVINGGPTVVEILERITPENQSYGKDYVERTKQMSTFFKSYHKKLRLEHEGPNYFRKLIMNSFAYKENEVIDALKKDLKANLEIYYRLNQYIAPKARILRLCDDLGQYDILLAQQDSQRKIDSIIVDQRKRNIAKTNYVLYKRAISYPDNLSAIENRKYDCILISNVIFAADLPELVKLSETIILIENSSLEQAIVASGFKIIATENNLIVLKKA